MMKCGGGARLVKRRTLRGDTIDLHVIREATKLIWEHGALDLKMDTIAVRSNISRATLYYRFGSRSRLILFTRHSIVVELLRHANCAAQGASMMGLPDKESEMT